MSRKPQLILAVNPGSASRKYALYEGSQLRASLHFELVKGQVLCTLLKDSSTRQIPLESTNFNSTIKLALGIFYKIGALDPAENLTAIGVRLAAPGTFFAGNHLVNETVLRALTDVKSLAPLHITPVLTEIAQLAKVFPHTKLLAISDSAFHHQRPELTRRYAIDQATAREAGVEKTGYHGLSVGAIAQTLPEIRRYRKLKKVIVAHLGSGCSITSLHNWRSFDTSMGYSPLEGLMSATRSGTVDVTAALRLKEVGGWTDQHLLEFLNRQSGLLGVSEKTGDLRELLALAEQGDQDAELAVEMFVSRIAGEIGRQIVGLTGVDALVFTGTIGERSAAIRARVLQKLRFLGFTLDGRLNARTLNPQDLVDISGSGGPLVLVVPADENVEIARQIIDFLA